ncbi:MAG: hypothetical protein ACRDNO_15470, partial [Trebonia sp.]
MLRVALWCVRTAGLGVVGLLTFLAPPSVRGGTATQSVAFAVICAGVAVWALADLARGAPAAVRRVGLPAALA